MSVNAVVQDGKVLDTGTNKKEKTASAAQGYDKDAFMNILCAQMKYQDPLEPTSNTEYINQYATFSQVEQLSNMAEAFSMTRASSLVGQTVIVTDENSKQIQGRVDYVTYSNNEAWLNIDGKDYSMDQVTSVADSDFVEMHDQADDLTAMIDKFPDYNNLNFTYAQDIYQAYSFYQNMRSDAIDLVGNEYISKLEKFKARIDELVEEATRNEEELKKKLAAEEASTTEEATNDSSNDTQSSNEG